MRFIYWMKQSSRQENVTYLAMWVMLFVTPVLSMYVNTSAGHDSFEWNELWHIWQKFAVFLALFLVHNFLLAPLLIQGQKRLQYFTLTLSIVTCFIIYQCNTRPDFPDRKHPPMEQGMHHHGFPDAPSAERPGNVPPHKPEREHVGPPRFIGEHDIVASVILILMFGMNLGVKGYFKSRNDRRKMQQLEKQNLEQQLEYLKYQINPHFFMNTLNNIHALVDIEPAKAQQTILELSKMMRFILYEGDKNGVPLSREIEFIGTYVRLMSLRYTDKVTIRMELPSGVPEKTIPPLILIPFVENAFKHGISYQKPSFIDIKVTVGQQLTFTCRNSKAETPNQERGGVGLNNVRRRLRLLYGENFTLNIKDNPEDYHVELIIPLS